VLSVRHAESYKLTLCAEWRYAEFFMQSVVMLSFLCKVSLCWVSLWWVSRRRSSLPKCPLKCKMGATTLSIITLSITTLSITFNDTQHNDTHYNGLIFNTQHNDKVHILPWFRLPLCREWLCWVSRFFYYYTECYYAECCKAECPYGESHVVPSKSRSYVSPSFTLSSSQVRPEEAWEESHPGATLPMFWRRLWQGLSDQSSSQEPLQVLKGLMF
jgi:hypothetical protein